MTTKRKVETVTNEELARRRASADHLQGLADAYLQAEAKHRQAVADRAARARAFAAAQGLELVPGEDGLELAAREDATAPYPEAGRKLGELVAEKQAAYGDSFGRSGSVMRILYSDGIRPDQLDDALVVVRILDKLFRIASCKGAFGESPYRDIAGYGLLGHVRDEERRQPGGGR